MDKNSMTLPANSSHMNTITKLNVKGIIMAVSNIINSQILDVKNLKQDLDNKTEIPPSSDLFFFSEEKYIREKPDEFDEERCALLREVPSLDNIYEFIKALYDCAQFSPECCIISLIYINRMITFTGIKLQPTTWRPITLCSLLVGQKVWDDKYLSNADFAFIYPFFVTSEITQLESKFLELLQYNMTVNSGLYAKYYFELRNLLKNDEFCLQALNNQQAEELEARSKEVKLQFIDWYERTRECKQINIYIKVLTNIMKFYVKQIILKQKIKK